MNVDPDFKLLVGGALAVLVLAGITLMSLAIIDGYDKSIRSETTIAANGITLPATANTSTTLASYPFLDELTGCVNASNGTHLFSTTSYRLLEGDRDGGYLYLTNVSWTGESINCSSATYRPAVEGSDSVPTFKAGLVVFATFMGVLVLAIVGMTVMRIMRKGD